MLKRVALLASHVSASLVASAKRFMKNAPQRIMLGIKNKETPWYKLQIEHSIRFRNSTRVAWRGPAFGAPKFPKFNWSRQRIREALFGIAFFEISHSAKNKLMSRRDRRRKARLASQVAFLSMRSASKVA